MLCVLGDTLPQTCIEGFNRARSEKRIEADLQWFNLDSLATLHRLLCIIETLRGQQRHPCHGTAHKQAAATLGDSPI